MVRTIRELTTLLTLNSQYKSGIWCSLELVLVDRTRAIRVNVSEGLSYAVELTSDLFQNEQSETEWTNTARSCNGDRIAQAATTL
jgi:hypothetical protein